MFISFNSEMSVIMYKYWVLKNKKNKNAAYIDEIPNSGFADWKYKKAIPLLVEFNKNVILTYSRNFPDAIELFDFVPNLLGVLIVSNRVKETLEEQGIEKIEYLPVAIYDHKKTEVDSKYWVLNILDTQDIIDMEKSKYVMGSLDKTQIKRIKKLVVSANKVSGEAAFFRATSKQNLFVMRDSLKSVFEKKQFTGYTLYEADGWNGFDF